MGNLYARLQEIIGEKIFRQKVTFDDGVVFNKASTGYAPVGGEPALGIPHPHSYQILNNYDPLGTPTTYDVDLSAQVPRNNSRLIYVYGYWAAATAGRNLSVQNTAGTQYGISFSEVANLNIGFSHYVRLGTDYTIRFVFSNADAVGAYCWMEFYYA